MLPNTAEFESRHPEHISEIYQAFQNHTMRNPCLHGEGSRPLEGGVEADIPEDQSPGALVSVKFKGP